MIWLFALVAATGPPVRSPALAMLLSGLTPAGGQVYTGRYVQAAILAPLEVGLGWLGYREHQRMAAAPDSASRSQYRTRRDTYLWWLGVSWVFSIADAYVGAHLYNFRGQEKLTLEVGFRLGP